MSPTFHLAKTLEGSRHGGIVVFWCGKGTSLTSNSTSGPTMVFQEEFSTCPKCRAAFAYAVTAPDPRQEMQESKYLPAVPGLKSETEMVG